MDALISGAPEGPERDHARLVSFAPAIQVIARKQGRDGTELSAAPAAIIAGMVARDDIGWSVFDQMQPTTLREAKKAPDGARGRVLKASGTILEIRVTKGLAEGALMTEDMTAIRFVTALSTKGLYEKSRATFQGVRSGVRLCQRCGRPDSVLGRRRSAFDLPDNRKKP